MRLQVYNVFVTHIYVIENVKRRALKKKKRNAPRGNALHVFKTVAAGRE